MRLFICHKLLFSFLMLYGLTNPLALAAKPEKEKTASLQARPLAIGRINGEASEHMSVVNIRFDRKPSWKKVVLEEHGTFLQIKLPDTIASNPGSFYEGNSPYIKKIAVYQPTANEAIVRLFTSAEARLVREAADSDILDNRLVVTIDHRTLRGKIEAASPPANKEEKPSEKASPLAALRKTGNKAPSGLSPVAWEDKLRNLAAFSLVFFVLVLAALTFRRVLRNRRILSAPDPLIRMQTLSDLTLAPKQKLSLVQVGHERILLSVSPDSISLITHLQAEGYPQGVQARSLAATSRRPLTSAAPQGLHAANSPAPGKPAKPKPNLAQYMESARSHSHGEVAPSENSQVTANAKAAGAASKKGQPKKIQYAIDDEGIKDQTLRSAPKPKRNPSTEKAIDDVTQLIREKLKSLPKIS